METQQAEWSNKTAVEEIFCIKDGAHFLEQLKNKLHIAPMATRFDEKYGVFTFSDNTTEIQVLIDREDLNICVANKGGDGDIKQKFSEFFKAATNHDLEIETLNDEEQQARREYHKLLIIRRQQNEYKQKIMDSLTQEDYEILKLRKKGKSIFAICKTLGVTKGRAEYKLCRMALIPELLEDVDKRFQPLTREERNHSC